MEGKKREDEQLPRACETKQMNISEQEGNKYTNKEGKICAASDLKIRKPARLQPKK